MAEHPWGVGMPAWLHLHDFADQCELAFCHFEDEGVYLVGSALRTRRPRDIDVRLEMCDSRFQAMFGGMDQFGKPGSKWASYCKAFSALGTQMTGKRIDFQIQPRAMALPKRDEPRIRLAGREEEK